jgi:hypothetical protein
VWTQIQEDPYGKKEKNGKGFVSPSGNWGNEIKKDKMS